MSARFAHTTRGLLLAGLLAMTGCGGGGDADLAADTTATDATGGMDTSAEMVATASLEPTEGNTARGTITFTQEGDAVRVQANLTGLAPGQHGFHVHENGDCGPADANGDGTPEPAGAAGGHFNPMGSPHGGPDVMAGMRHVGDFGNIEAGSDSTASFERTDSLVALSGTNDVIGKAVVVHANPDDLQTDPSGNSGGRIACGVIQMAGDMSMPQDTAAATTL